MGQRDNVLEGEFEQKVSWGQKPLEKESSLSRATGRGGTGKN
jgi:hypothetical protein